MAKTTIRVEVNSSGKSSAADIAVRVKPPGFFKSLLNRIEYHSDFVDLSPDSFTLPPYSAPSIGSMPAALRESRDGGRPSMPISGSNFAVPVETADDRRVKAGHQRHYALITKPGAKESFSAVVKGEYGGHVPLRYNNVKPVSECTADDTILWQGKADAIILLPSARRTFGSVVKQAAKTILMTGAPITEKNVFRDAALRLHTNTQLFSLPPAP